MNINHRLYLNIYLFIFITFFAQFNYLVKKRISKREV